MVPTSSTIRWGILGTGGIAHDFAHGLSVLPNAKLLAVGSRSPETAQTFAQTHQIPKAYSSYEALVEDADIDVVYIATPHIRHKQDSLLCLNSGKAVLCEKPLAINAQEASEIVAVARQQQLFCMEAMWMRFMPLIQQVQRLIKAGAIGEVLTLTADFGYPTEFDPNNRFFNLNLGGGALLDRGVYPLSLAFQLLGAPIAVAGQACLGKTGVDEQVALVLTFPGGELAQLAATLRGYATNTAVITGTRGKITIHPPFCRPDKITITPLSDEPIVLSTRRSNPSPQPNRRFRAILEKLPLAQGVLGGLRDQTESIAEPIVGNGFNYEAMEVIQCLHRNQLESSIMPLDESMQILKVIDELRQQWGLCYPQEKDFRG